MNVLGDIVERMPDVREGIGSSEGVFDLSLQKGFPEFKQPEKVSNWRVRLQQKRQNKQLRQENLNRTAVFSSDNKEKACSEAERISRENIDYISRLDPAEVQDKRKQLLESLDPKLVQVLLSRIAERDDKEQGSLFPEIEGASGTWVGEAGSQPNISRLDEKKIDETLGIKSGYESYHTEIHDENIYRDQGTLTEDKDDIAPGEYQFIKSMDHMTNEQLMQDVHFVKNKGVSDMLDIEDPMFMEKLHTKYFPDLEKEHSKLEWMKPVLDQNGDKNMQINDVSECRFDFRGNLVPFDRNISTLNSGLHHHSDNPQFAGYTIPELAHLSRSKFCPQRCLAIQTLGRILYKLGKQFYCNLVPIVDAETYKIEGGVNGITEKIYSMFWDLVNAISVLNSLYIAADEKKTTNINVRNYATEALWMWRQGGGDPRDKKSAIQST